MVPSLVSNKRSVGASAPLEGPSDASPVIVKHVECSDAGYDMNLPPVAPKLRRLAASVIVLE